MVDIAAGVSVFFCFVVVVFIFAHAVALRDGVALLSMADLSLVPTTHWPQVDAYIQPSQGRGHKVQIQLRIKKLAHGSWIGLIQRALTMSLSKP